MPFKSKKQERYLSVHEPELAAKWRRKYGSVLGGAVANGGKKHRGSRRR
jgi:hypothetical protein